MPEHRELLQYRSLGRPPISGMAVASMIVGIVSIPLDVLFFIGALGGVVAIGLGIAAITQIQRRQEHTGKPFAVVGITLGVLSILLAIAGLILLLRRW
jgi:hypothetical protein